MEDEYLASSSSNGQESPLTKQMEPKPASDALCGMTEKEIQQHLEHCMKLAAENKINMKNAFGLHLINIMQNMVKQKGSTDLTLASLSLQASSKIYASRIEALYKETYQFHGHLQTIVVGGKSAANSNAPADDYDDMNSDETAERRPQKKKLKSYLGSEDSITLASTQRNSFTTMPHGNFELIKSAFSTARTARRLLDSLPLECDSCKLNCAASSKCFKVKESLPEAVKFHLSKKITEKLTGIENLNIKSTEFDDIESANKTMDVFLDAIDPWDGGNDTNIADNSNHAVDVMIDRFSVLDITADMFARDISQAITKGNEIDERLLPPQSALKRVLKTAEKKPRTIGDDKKKKEKKPREPFFTIDQIVDDSLFLPGKKINLTNAAISEWCLSETTELCTGHNTLFSELTNHDESDKNSGEKVKAFYNVITEMEPQYCLKNYFFKRPALWKRCRRLHSPLKTSFSLASNARPSSFGMLRNPEMDHNASFENEEGMVQSFRDLSLHDSFENNHCGDGPIDLPSPAKSDELLSIINNRSGFLEEDIQMMMVTPPELVKPLNVRYNQKPLNIDSDRLKTCMWSVISANLMQNSTKSVLFSEVHTEVQKRYKPDKHEIVPQQLSFVILLILANLKELYLENIEDNKDIIIKMDSSNSTSERIEIY